MKKAASELALLFFLAGIGSAQTITVTQPGAGVIWNIGGTYVIQWTPTGPTQPAVKIMLWQGSTNVLDIVASTPNNGSYSWTIPAAVAPGSYKVRVRAIGANTLGIGAAFNIAGASTGQPARMARPIDSQEAAAFRMKFPALSISNITLSPNADGFVITFGYKNSGTGPLPKGSEVPVKPNFRLIIDDREVARGSLFIPESPAPPGWEVQTYQGCVLKYPPGPGFDFEWTIGNFVTVKINENEINGMKSDSKSLNLKQTALNYSYDARITGATLDWKTGILTMNIRVDGQIGPLHVLYTQNNPSSGYFGYFAKHIDLVPGQNAYTITQNLGNFNFMHEYKCHLFVALKGRKEDFTDRRDIEHQNNQYTYSFHD
jgi:Kre9/KNH-like N-terminal Ig-like domain